MKKLTKVIGIDMIGTVAAIGYTFDKKDWDRLIETKGFVGVLKAIGVFAVTWPLVIFGRFIKNI